MTSLRLVSHDMMRLCHTHISTKFKANRSRNTATVAEKPSKLTLWRNNVATSLRHDVFFQMIRCDYVIPMFPPNLKHIGRETWLQWLKNPQNLRYDVITSLRHYVITSFFGWYDTARPYPCFHQIWSNSAKKHGHNREKRVSAPSHCQPTSKFKNRAPSRHAPLPYLSCVQIWRRSVEKQKSLNNYKFGRGGGGGWSSNVRCFIIHPEGGRSDLGGELSEGCGWF